MWTQVVGKVALARTPMLNHYWNAALQPTSRGLATRCLDAGAREMVILFDFVAHELRFELSDGNAAEIQLRPMTVAEFYARVMDTLDRLGAHTPIWATPVEIPDPIPFDEDTVHGAYDPASVSAFWRATVAMRPVFEAFRGRFLGKSSPVHFFWGSFDLASTRFSGRRAPERPDADAVTREAYSHEVISHGFWPGSGAVQEAAFYAYAAPEPEGFAKAPIRPAGARYVEEMKLFVLPWEAVRTAPSPAQELTVFLESTYDHAADAAGWDRAALERA